MPILLKARDEILVVAKDGYVHITQTDSEGNENTVIIDVEQFEDILLWGDKLVQEANQTEE